MRTNRDGAMTFPHSLHTAFLTAMLWAMIPGPAQGRCSVSLLGQLISCDQLTNLNEAQSKHPLLSLYLGVPSCRYHRIPEQFGIKVHAVPNPCHGQGTLH